MADHTSPHRARVNMLELHSSVFYLHMLSLRMSKVVRGGRDGKVVWGKVGFGVRVGWGSVGWGSAG